MKITELIKKQIVYFDGGTGSILQGKGLKPGELPELWNIDRPDDIVAIHRSYLDAGSNIINTNTFGANSLKFTGKDGMPSLKEVVEGKRVVMIDDSIVRGTQMRETVEFLYENGAKEVHMRSACPPIMFGCKYLTFSRNKSIMDLIARRVVHKLEGEEGVEHCL